ncbi:AAA family ATPase [Leptolyngbya sp. PCC 6406]|uniref:AAA family ATPase n=1 Tax=Leptolyngbya sp. PCC 6406 TaxID=1173264 RepID=UPI0002AC8FEA|nr:AAA family ATPase [Leptolyngbya sp. PCC 6406]
MSDWKFFTAQPNPDGTPRQQELEPISARPAWRQFMSQTDFEQKWQQASEDRWEALRKEKRLDARSVERGASFRIRQVEGEQSEIITAVNSALALRRPLLITGNPGSGKTSLAYAIAYELKLGPVLLWPITTRSKLTDALYRYDAIARLQDTQFDKSELELQILLAKAENQDPDRAQIDELKKGRSLGDYIQLGPVGTAFLPSHLPRVLLIDEIDKSDLNLPNDLLNLFEEGRYEISELARQKSDAPVSVRTEDDDLDAEIEKGKVTCYEFPLVIMTSNGERDFPPAFLRRCLRIKMPDPTDSTILTNIVGSHFDRSDRQPTEQPWSEVGPKVAILIEKFAEDLKTKPSSLATDQLLNLIYMVRQSQLMDSDLGDEKNEELNKLKQILLRRLTNEASR